MNTRQVGNAYEDLACEHLVDEGMQILLRNYRVKIGEIDIIAKDGNELVFAEVKYRKSSDFGGAQFAIPVSKQKTIRRVAEWFMNHYGYPQSTFCRFDAILIDGSEVTHIKNAW